jgi:hypothetical protein
MSIKKHIKENPIASISLFITLCGVAVTLANYLIISRMEPIVTRVSAIENKDLVRDQKLDQFLEIKGQVSEMSKTLDKISNRMGISN